MITLTPNHQARAFSLVEILIAILVLGFGLLGLAAVFPVVVSQQRDAANEMRGPSAVASVKAQLVGETDMVDWSKVVRRSDPNLNPNVSPPSGLGQWVFDFQKQGLNAQGQRTVRIDQDGNVTLVSDGPDKPDQFIPTSARLFPSVYGSVSPQFVWDIAVRRTADASPLEVAIFLRRLDAGIRVPDGKRLANVLTGEGLRPGGNVEPAAVPIGETPEGANDNQRRPTGNGTGEYSRLRELSIRPQRAGGSEDLPADRFPVPGAASKLIETLVGREGQLLLDDLGVVRTVQGFESDGAGRRLIVVNPPFPSTDQRVIVYTPQTPVAIEIFTVGDN
ncbi:MAG: prepilin-type N-terminal cleavage/methylation domain-containing protein [Phycisphaerales bacterium]